MSNATTRVCGNTVIRTVRDSDYLIIQIRTYSLKAEIDTSCQVVDINRDSITRRLISITRRRDKVNSDDLAVL